MEMHLNRQNLVAWQLKLRYSTPFISLLTKGKFTFSFTSPKGNSEFLNFVVRRYVLSKKGNLTT